MQNSDTSERVSQTAIFDEAVGVLRFASRKRVEALQALNITSVRDLLHHYPFRYDDYSDIVSIRSAPLGLKVSIFARVDEIKQKRPRPNLSLTEISVVDESSTLHVTWFNKPWIAKNLSHGSWVFLSGKVEHAYGYRRMTNPVFSILEKTEIPGDASEETAVSRQSSIVPTYHANAGISNAWVSRLIKTALDQAPAPLDPIPPELRIELGLMSYQGALREIHQPHSQTTRREARKRLAFDEILFLMLYLKRKRNNQQKNSTPFSHITTGSSCTTLPTLLPFTLTADQLNAIQEILEDMSSPKIMNRLLLGDVGSGKTIVAAHALAAVHDTGSQAAMMAPTEVLAQQYALKLGPLFDQLEIPWALLTSSTPTETRKSLLDQLTHGELSVLFGTHSLIEPTVIFKNLSLIIIDEQHRFGVEQREALRHKAPRCDALMMTATPIPRSLALVLYGDLSPTYLLTRHQTSTVTTRLLDRSGIGEGYDGIREALDQGHQAYVICPLISTSSAPEENGIASFGEDEDAGTYQDEHESVIDLFTDLEAIDDHEGIRAAEREAAFLQNKVFPEHTIGLLTGRMPAKKKNAIMEQFRFGAIDVLVSTTVVEVGVDVPNATLMIVEDADRFGLSQLHQLRGRIGRGAWDGKFFLVTQTKNEETRNRLKLLEQISDGFKLAEADLLLRREGDILGSRQHGKTPLKLIKVIEDADIVALANHKANILLEQDPQLCAPEHALLSHEIEQRLSFDEGQVQA